MQDQSRIVHPCFTIHLFLVFQPQMPLQSSFNFSDATFISEEINVVDGTTVDYFRLKTNSTQAW